jgi:quercetin dioxygenase-like cupin family protein
MKRGMLDELAELPVTHNPEIKKKVLFKDGDLPSITQYSQATFLPGQRAPAHAHEDMYEVFLCVSGSGLMTIDGEAFALSPGAYFACAPGELHEIANNGSTPLLIHQLGVRAQQSMR